MMFGLRKLLRKLLSGQNKTDSSMQSSLPILREEKRPNFAKEENDLSDISRESYFFQIGFDFGTSTSKAIIRDINKNRAWVYNNITNPNYCSFLVPTVIIFEDGRFSRFYKTGEFYPKNGLYHLKMVIGLLLSKNFNEPIFHEYGKIIGTNCPNRIRKITELACIYFLTTAFSEIINHVKEKFTDYGDNPDDQMAINMAIPVAHVDEAEINNKFEEMLNKAWFLANSDELISTQNYSVDNLEYLIESISIKKNDLCFVYPEVSANVQAFIHSPAASPDDTTIYFFSDTGAGTVDQSVFTYATGSNSLKLLNYFSAKVYPHGSGQIDILACGENLSEVFLEFWRNMKENNGATPELVKARNFIFEALKKDSHKTFNHAIKCLPYGKGVEPLRTLKEKTKFIFGGGGHSKYPYETAVTNAFNDLFEVNSFVDIISIRAPQDLDLSGMDVHGISRLYVAYGLSFSSLDLADNTFPSQNVLSSKQEDRSLRYCSCRGINKNCIRCGGSGMI